MLILNTSIYRSTILRGSHQRNCGEGVLVNTETKHCFHKVAEIIFL